MKQTVISACGYFHLAYIWCKPPFYSDCEFSICSKGILATPFNASIYTSVSSNRLFFKGNTFYDGQITILLKEIFPSKEVPGHQMVYQRIGKKITCDRVLVICMIRSIM